MSDPHEVHESVEWKRTARQNHAVSYTVPANARTSQEDTRPLLNSKTRFCSALGFSSANQKIRIVQEVSFEIFEIHKLPPAIPIFRNTDSVANLSKKLKTGTGSKSSWFLSPFLSPRFSEVVKLISADRAIDEVLVMPQAASFHRLSSDAIHQ